MIIDFNRYNGGGSSSAVTPEQVQLQIDSALTPYWDSAATEDAISAATAGKADKVAVTPNTDTYNGHFPLWNADGVITGEGDPAYRAYLILNGETNCGFWSQDGNSPNIYAPTISGNPGEVLVSTGSGAPVWSAVTMGGNSNILAAITSQAEYGAISGSVKTGDLIQVWDVDINGDGGEYGLFQADVQEIEDQGVITKEITWNRADSSDSLNWNYKDYPWLTDNDVYPVDFGRGGFLISDTEPEGFNGIGFDGDGKAVITHIVPQYEEGEVTGMTREDRDILGELDTLDEVVSQALVDLNEKKVESQDIKHIVKLTQADYDQLVFDGEVDPYTFYIIVNNN